MAQVKLLDCYFGMALSWLFRNKIKPVLISSGEQKQIYEFTTNTSQKDFILYLIYRTQKDNKKDDYSSWSFGDIRENITELMGYGNDNKHLVLALICVKKKIKDSEIAFLFDEDIESIRNKTSITLSRKTGEKYFRLFMGESRDKSRQIKCDPDFEVGDYQ
jgi:hypothetical protein